MRKLTPFEIQNLEELTKYSIQSTLIEPTATGLKKSILDATGSVRAYLKDQNIHDYLLQQQGQDHKVFISGKLLSEKRMLDSRISLYKPTTKKGDPRIWLTNLKHIVDANDIVALIYFDSYLYGINISKINITALIKSSIANPIKELVLAISENTNIIANELLALLHKIAAMGPIPALLNADTGVGRTLEHLLGVNINSSKEPDYKGIELKSFRGNKNNRKTLFAQVPNWKISKFKSSAEILTNFGYQSDQDFQLNCTVSTLARNPQSLMLRFDGKENLLFENSDRRSIGDFVAWEIDILHKRLLEKHNETFWITAESTFVNGVEHFHYKKVEHTKKPIVSQFNILLEQGMITLDHLIKRKPSGRVSERGPLFKIKPSALALLFPPSRIYDL